MLAVGQALTRCGAASISQTGTIVPSECAIMHAPSNPNLSITYVYIDVYIYIYLYIYIYIYISISIYLLDRRDCLRHARALAPAAAEGQGDGGHVCYDHRPLLQQRLGQAPV